MKVIEYETRFHSLDRHSLMSIPSEEEMIWKFVKGLTTSLYLDAE